MNSGGVDPLSYSIHAGKLQAKVSDTQDLYRLQLMHSSPDSCVGVGYHVISCQCVGNLSSDESQLEAAKGSVYPPIKVSEESKDMDVV